MCTVTWCRQGESYEVFFNRDERLTRLPAQPPRVQMCNGVRFVAPVDAAAGGTWLAANEHGVTVGLLNYYEAGAATHAARPISRGLLVASLMDRASASAVMVELGSRELDRYAPFVLIALDARGTQAARWDGRTLERGALTDRDLPVSTSSFDTARVLERRRARFVELVGAGGPAAGRLEEFHRSVDPRGGAYSVWMTREDAQTVSFSRVRVDPGAIRFGYEPRGAEDPSVAVQVVTLAREGSPPG